MAPYKSLHPLPPPSQVSTHKPTPKKRSLSARAPRHRRAHPPERRSRIHYPHIHTDMDAVLLLSADPLAAAAGSRALPAGPRPAAAAAGRLRAPCVSVRSAAAPAASATRGLARKNHGVQRVVDFMTRKEDIHVVKPTTSVDEALEKLVNHRTTGFPVIDDNCKLVGVVSDYDLLSLDLVSGNGLADASIFPDVDSTWKTLHDIQKLLSKANGRVVGDVMTSAPLAVRGNTDLEDAARLLLQTKYHKLPVVDSMGKLVGIITRGSIVRAALKTKKSVEGST